MLNINHTSQFMLATVLAAKSGIIKGRLSDRARPITFTRRWKNPLRPFDRRFGFIALSAQQHRCVGFGDDVGVSDDGAGVGLTDRRIHFRIKL
jgi:hypothetical protein